MNQEPDAAYESIVEDVKTALAEGRISEKEYKIFIAAVHRGKFRNDQDPRNDLEPIEDKIWPDEAKGGQDETDI